jgi:hypothetical protein
MKLVNCEQGSEEWLAARLGIATASRFQDVLTQPRSKKDKEAGLLSESAMTYMCELIAERLTGEMREISTPNFEWGHIEEPKARTDYGFSRNVTMTPVGLILRDDGLVGASPDSLIDEDGGLEIKSPLNPAIHLKTVIREEMPAEHMAQVQGCMMIAERDWWDFMSYRGDMPGAESFVVRINRDDVYIAKLTEALDRFNTTMQEHIAIIEQRAA